jgi:hypothetical protein
VQLRDWAKAVGAPLTVAQRWASRDRIPTRWLHGITQVIAADVKAPENLTGWGTVVQYAAAHGLDQQTVYRKVRNGGLPARKVEDVVLLPVATIPPNRRRPRLAWCTTDAPKDINVLWQDAYGKLRAGPAPSDAPWVQGSQGLILPL